jgi:dihydrofolate reductase
VRTPWPSASPSSSLFSLDGFIARPDGGIDWLGPFHGEDHGYGPFFAGVDALVIGRGTYDAVVGFPEWPYGDKRLIVCTGRPADPRHGEEVWSGTPRELAERLEREGVRRVYLDGGALIRSFLREGLVDELAINVVPLILGSGLPLFASGLPEIPLRFVESKSYPSGLVQIRYQRA